VTSTLGRTLRHHHEGSIATLGGCQETPGHTGMCIAHTARACMSHSAALQSLVRCGMEAALHAVADAWVVMRVLAGASTHRYSSCDGARVSALLRSLEVVVAGCLQIQANRIGAADAQRTGRM
jgi:hypothetical protein